MERWAGYAILAIGLATSLPALAQEVTPDALIEQGVAARRAGDDEGALALFTRAYEMDHSSRSRAQMALAEQALGMWMLADTHLREALAASGDGWIEAHRDVLESSLADIGTRLGELEVRCAFVGADVRINGESRGTTPLSEPLRVPAGTVTVDVIARGFVPITREVVIEAGGMARETFELHAADTGFRAGVSARATEASSGPGIVGEWWFWTILGVVVVGAGVGIGVGVASSGTTTQDPLVPQSGLVITTLSGP